MTTSHRTMQPLGFTDSRVSAQTLAGPLTFDFSANVDALTELTYQSDDLVLRSDAKQTVGGVVLTLTVDAGKVVVVDETEAWADIDDLDGKVFTVDASDYSYPAPDYDGPPP